MTAGALRTLTITAEIRDELQRDARRAVRPTILVRAIGVLLGLGGVVVVLLAAVAGDEGDWVPPAVGLLAVVGSILTIHLSQRRQLRAAIDHAFPVGSVVDAALEVNGLRMSTAVSSATTAYREFRDIERIGSVVVLHPARRAMRTMHVGALFEEADLAELRARFALGR